MFSLNHRILARLEGQLRQGDRALGNGFHVWRAKSETSATCIVELFISVRIELALHCLSWLYGNNLALSSLKTIEL